MSVRSLPWVFLALLLLLSASARADEKVTKESLESRGGESWGTVSEHKS